MCGTGQPRLLSLVEQHLAQADRYLRFHLAAMGRHHLSQEEHLAMLEAALACRVLATHVGTAAKSLQIFLKERGSNP